MKRLTKQDAKGTWGLKFVPWNCLKSGVIISEEVSQKIHDAICRLKDYENTGLSPQQVKQLQDDSWIPVDDERKPGNGDYVLVSFDNFSLPDIARYEEDDNGGTFYPGDMEESYLKIGLIVNAWKPLPAKYQEGIDIG